MAHIPSTPQQVPVPPQPPQAHPPPTGVLGAAVAQPTQQLTSLHQVGPDTCAYEDVLSPVAEACALQALLAGMPPGPFRRALAVQGGSGALAMHLPASEVMVTDTSRPLLARAQKKAAQRRLRSRYSLWHGTFERLPPPASGKQFDLIFVDGLRLAPPEPGHLAPLRAAIEVQLAPGGVLVLLSHQSKPLPPFAYTPLEVRARSLGPWDTTLVCYVR